MASSYQHIDTILDGDGDGVDIGVLKDLVVVIVGGADTDQVHLDAAQREQFQRAFMAAERAAETYDPAHPF